MSILIPDSGPLGETFPDASVRAIVTALFVNSPGGGCVESVVTVATQRFLFRFIVVPMRLSRCQCVANNVWRITNHSVSALRRLGGFHRPAGLQHFRLDTFRILQVVSQGGKSACRKILDIGIPTGLAFNSER
ncbi:MAG: hypothetical protein WB566_03625, partial [Terriglobales bacterium]